MIFGYVVVVGVDGEVGGVGLLILISVNGLLVVLIKEKDWSFEVCSEFYGDVKIFFIGGVVVYVVNGDVVVFFYLLGQCYIDCMRKLCCNVGG